MTHSFTIDSKSEREDARQVEVGTGPLFLIAGPCVIEAEPLMMRTAERLKKIAASLGISVIYKSSFSKDNRSSLDYYQGPGLEEGLKLLAKPEI